MANVRIYIDGFNLYYRALKGTPFLWLNVDALCRTILPMHNILGIKYFTAVVGARPGDPAKPQRQATYFRALRTLPNLTIHQGQFRTRQIKLPLSNTNPPRMVYVDASRPDLVLSFTEKTFIAMIEGVRQPAIAAGLITTRRFDAGLRDLRRATRPDGVFCYTFFKGVGVPGKPSG